MLVEPDESEVAVASGEVVGVAEGSTVAVAGGSAVGVADGMIVTAGVGKEVANVISVGGGRVGELVAVAGLHPPIHTDSMRI